MKRKVWPLIILLCIALIFPAASQAAPIPPPGAVSLVRIDLGSKLELPVVARVIGKHYALLELERGKIAAFLPADADQRNALAYLGYAVQVQEADLEAVSRAGRTVFLLYGLPEDLEALQDEDGLLAVSGRQAVAVLSEERAAMIMAGDIRVTRLTPQPIDTSRTAGPQKPENMAQSPVIAGMLEHVKTEDLTGTLLDLTGERPATINGKPYTIRTRNTGSYEPLDQATQYAYERFSSLGLETRFDTYQFPLYPKTIERNVVAQQTGLVDPAYVVLLGAHIDSTSNVTPEITAPGADDNASGSVAVMHIARILSNYHFGCTLRYVLFTGEEQGIFGSAAYAEEIRRNGEVIQGMVNLDMLAYNTVGSPATFEVHARSGNAADLALANLFVRSVDDYSIGLNPILLPDSMRSSDHAAFWDRGFPAIIAIEDWTDHTPYYHCTGDQIESLNLPYYTEMVKAALATFAHLGCLMDGQAAGVIRNAADDAPLAGITVEAWQGDQRIAKTYTGADGSYSLPLLPGGYRLRFFGPGRQGQESAEISIQSTLETNLDVALTTCDTVQSPSFGAVPAQPGVGQPVMFSAGVNGGEAPITYTWSFSDGQSGTGEQVTEIFEQPGLVEIKLTSDNACGYPVATRGNLLIGDHVLYLAMVNK